MTDPELREARIAEAKRRTGAVIWEGWGDAFAHHLCDLIESDWRPEPEVDAVTLAAREWMVGNGSITTAAYIHDGNADQSTFADAFRAGHAHALANCADAKRMDWLEGQVVTVLNKQRAQIIATGPEPGTLRAKIDRAMGGGQ